MGECAVFEQVFPDPSGKTTEELIEILNMIQDDDQVRTLLIEVKRAREEDRQVPKEDGKKMEIFSQYWFELIQELGAEPPTPGNRQSFGFGTRMRELFILGDPDPLTPQQLIEKIKERVSINRAEKGLKPGSTDLRSLLAHLEKGLKEALGEVRDIQELLGS